MDFDRVGAANKKFCEPGRLTATEVIARQEANKQGEPRNLWDERLVYFRLANGWTIEAVNTAEDRVRMGMRDANCVGGPSMDVWVRQKKYRLLSLRDQEGNSQGTILLGNPGMIPLEYSPEYYGGEGKCNDLKMGENVQVSVDGEAWYFLQIRDNSRGYNSPVSADKLEMVQAWVEQNQPEAA